MIRKFFSPTVSPLFLSSTTLFDHGKYQMTGGRKSVIHEKQKDIKNDKLDHSAPTLFRKVNLLNPRL